MLSLSLSVSSESTPNNREGTGQFAEESDDLGKKRTAKQADRRLANRINGFRVVSA